ncbi:MAG TPA: cytochrome c [Candidatus Acidoferrum sp.]|nr:cytochrome c [Candidatus Acidoferrum sp.]
MKRTIPALFLILSLALLAAGGPPFARLRSGDYQAPKLGKLEQTARPELVADGLYRVAAYPLYPPELAAGEGKQETEAYCVACHGTRYISMQPPLPAATWEAEVNKMNKAFGANIPEAVSQKIVRYLQANYTPETRRQ